MCKGVPTRRGRGRVHRKHTTRKDHRRRSHKRTMRKHRGGYLSTAVRSTSNRPSRWAYELRSVFAHGVRAVASLDKAITHTINSKIYVKTAAGKSPEYRATDNDSAVMQLLEEADAEIIQTRQAVAEATRKTGNMLKKTFPSEASAYGKTIDEALGRVSRTDTTTPKGSWIEELNIAYDSVIAAASRLKNSVIPTLEQAKKDENEAKELGSWDPKLLRDIEKLGVKEAVTAGLRDLNDAHDRLSRVAKRMAAELKKHGIKGFEKKHDYNLRHYLK